MLCKNRLYATTYPAKNRSPPVNMKLKRAREGRKNPKVIPVRTEKIMMLQNRKSEPVPVQIANKKRAVPRNPVINPI